MDISNISLSSLPPRYQTVNYLNCANNAIYCRIFSEILPNPHSDAWKEILKTNVNKDGMDRSYLYRGFCLERNTTELDLIKIASDNVNEETSPLNLTTRTIEFSCFENNGGINDASDWIVLILFTLLSITVLLATVLYPNKETPKGRFGAVLSKFSITHNWKIISKTSGNDDFERLKSIQGIRIFAMICILIIHAKLHMVWMYVFNVDFFERLLKTFELQNLFEQFLVQIFFLISSVLLTNQIWNFYKKNGEFSFKDAVILLLNRYFRFQITSVVVILLYYSNFLQYINGPVMQETSKMMQNSCRKNWISTLFLYNNFFHLEDQCNLVTWYLAADFQMYAVLTLILFIKFKYGISEWKILPLALVVSMVSYASVIYEYNLDILFRPIMRNIELEHIRNLQSYKLNYESTYSIASTYILGALVGFVYFRTKNITISYKKIATIIWVMGFVGFPFLTVFICRYEYQGILAAVFGCLIKPLYALGFGIGILGMSLNLGGFFKSFSENRYFVILSNFSFSIYLLNMLPAVMKVSRNTEPITGTPFFVFQELMTYVITGILYGVILTFLVEYPMLQIQKMVLPQIKRSPSQRDLGKET